MLKALGAGVVAAVMFAFGLSSEPVDAQAVPTPAGCAAARTRAERAGMTRAEIDQMVATLMVENRDSARVLNESVIALAREVSNNPSAPERLRPNLELQRCLREARLAQLDAAAAAPRPIVIVTNQPADTTTGGLARALAAGWEGATLQAPPSFINSLEAIEAFEAGPADGSRLLIFAIPLSTDAIARRVLSALAPLQPVLMVAGPRTTNPVNSGVALFAPSRTASPTVSQLRNLAAQASAAPSFADERAVLQLSPPSGTISQTLAAVLSRLVDAAGAPVTARTGNAPASGNRLASTGPWPLGIAPGNLYVIQGCRTGTTGPCDDGGFSLRSGTSLQNALGGAPTSPPGGGRYHVVECTGPNWGALVALLEFQPNGQQGKSYYGASCGAPTPGDAVREAGEWCRRSRGRPCALGGAAGWFKVFIGHSGERHAGGSNNSDPMAHFNSQLWALGPPINNTEQLLQSPEDAVAKLGRMCSSQVMGGQVPCFVTFRSVECTQYRGNGHPGCLDPAYTASGIQPFTVPRRDD